MNVSDTFPIKTVIEATINYLLIVSIYCMCVKSPTTKYCDRILIILYDVRRWSVMNRRVYIRNFRKDLEHKTRLQARSKISHKD